VKNRCALGKFFIEKLRNCGFFNTIAHWSMTVRLFLRDLQTCGAFVAGFTSEK
jgi:hypothetical protein